MMGSLRGSLDLPSSSSIGRTRLTWDCGTIKVCQELEIYNFDLCGRPVIVTRKNDIFRRGLDGKVVKIWRTYQGEEKFHTSRTLEEPSQRRFLQSVREKVESLRPHLGEEFRWLQPVLDIDLASDAETFRELYQEVGILPPDCYRMLLLNLTQGCSYNKCSFCHFFKGKSFSLRSPAQFQRHIEQLKQAFGPSLASRRGIFLGQANAANAPMEYLESALLSIQDAFPSSLADRNGERRHPWGFERVSSFMDTFSQLQRQATDWQKLYALGLRALYLGIESGSPRVLKLLRKPGHPRLAKELVDTLKAVGFEVNVIIMTGVGGKEMAAEHVDQTTMFLNSLPLKAGDRIYLSAFVPAPNSQYRQLAEERGLTAMSPLECRAQSGEIRRRLCLDPFPQGPARTLYDIAQFVY